MRFGQLRHLNHGWLEERLPFIFIWLPEWFKKQNPGFVEALKINRNRLTTPYDLHMTLKHILKLSNPNPNRVYEPAAGCPKCQSLFTELPLNRSCEDASIEAHWCTCPKYLEHDKNDKIVRDIVNFVLKDINEKLKTLNDAHNKPLCAQLKLEEIASVRKAEHRNGNDDSYDDYVVVYSVAPSLGWYESTVRHRNNTGFEISSSMSRLNRYSTQSGCMKIDDMQKYCFCLDQHT